MLTEVGRVVALETDSVWVETIRNSTCGVCAAKKACGHGLLNSMGNGKRGYVRVLPGERPLDECHVDDQVLISIPEEIILRGSFIAYIIPLLGMLAGAQGAVQLLSGNPDLLAAGGAVAGLVAGFGIVRWHGVNHQQDPDYQPVLLQVLPANYEAVTVQ
jgi:sigma-E factor negative regulatory protein RseC